VKPTRDIIEWVGAEVLADHPFVSLDAVVVAVYERDGRLIDMKKHSMRLPGLVSADRRIWVTPRLGEIEGRPRA
jgi:hypothetical protein